MTSVNVAPELKQVLGAMLFGSRLPVAVDEMRRVLVEMGENPGEEGKLFAKVVAADIQSALDQLKADLTERHMGVHLVEVAGGFRFQTDAECGPWLRHLLDIGKPTKLTRPTLETLAIIAYRQPVTRAEIEAVRGVTVDTIVRHLMELQLIRLVGRSPLPGRPLLYGTTQLFLEHFGLKSLKDMPGIEQLCRREEEYKRRQRPPAPPAEGAEQENADGQAAPGVAPGPDQETVPEKKADASAKGDIAGEVEEKSRQEIGPENSTDHQIPGADDKNAGAEDEDEDEDEDETDEEEDEDEDDAAEGDKDAADDEDENDDADDEDEDESEDEDETERPTPVKKEQLAETKPEPGSGEGENHEHESGEAQKSN